MNSKGQSSFEMIALISFVTVIALIVMFNYFVVSDSTTAVSILKTIAVKELNADSSYHFINNIDFSVNTAENSITLSLLLQPKNPELNYSVKNSIAIQAKNEIEKKTSYRTA